MRGCVDLSRGGGGPLTFGGREEGGGQKRECPDFQFAEVGISGNDPRINNIIVARISALFPSCFISVELSKSGSNK